jgi:hypothetical protein
MQIQQAMRLSQQARNFAVSFRANELFNRQSLGRCQSNLQHDLHMPEILAPFNLDWTPCNVFY